MLFNAPQMLWSLFALLIPIAVHLFNFRRWKKVYFSNVDRLLAVRSESRRSSTLRQWLILAARLVAVGAIVLAFARPVIPSSDGLTTTGSNAVSIYLDNTFSMESGATEGSLLETARLKAHEVVSAYGIADHFHVLTADMRGADMRWLSREEALSVIDTVRPTAASPLLSAIAQRQIDFLSQHPASNHHAYIISDFQRSAADLALLPSAGSASVCLVPLRTRESDNLYIDTILLDAPAYFEGSNVSLNVRLRNSGHHDAHGIPLRLYTDGKERAVASVDIPAGGSATSSLRFSLSHSGPTDCQLLIDDYPITFDDEYFFSLHTSDRLSLLHAGSPSPNPFLSRLFSADSTLRVAHSRQLPPTLDSFDLVLLTPSSPLSSGEARLLSEWVAAGGSLLFVPSPEADAPGAELSALTSMPRLTKWSQASVRASSIDYAHHLFLGVFDGHTEDMELPSAFGHYLSEGGNAQTIISLADGSPLLADAAFGLGHIYLFSTPLLSEYTDFVNQALFVPTLYNMLLYSRPLPPPAHTIGSEAAIPLLCSYNPSLSPPPLRSSSASLLPDIRRAAGRSILVPHGEISLPGIYSLPLEHIAFNLPRRESVMEFFSPEEVEQLASSLPSYSTLRHTEQHLGEALRLRAAGRPLWHLFLILALAALAAETALIKTRR